ncbi:hypothetical protein ACQ4PT_007321 [Festuca glaucescens]
MAAPPPPPQPAAAGGYAARFSPSGFIHAPLAALLEYSSGVLRAQANGGGGPQRGEAADGEVSIRIVGPDGQPGPPRAPGAGTGETPVDEEAPAARGDEAAAGRADPPYGGYDVQRAARWVEHALPFSLLLLGVFIRQHLQDTMVRQAAMVVKCVLLMYYRNSKGRHYRRQGQMLTVVEYSLLLYRALLPAPVWYRFFLNKEYGGLFSSLTTGLYLTFKVASMVEKVRSLLASVSALSQKDLHYGLHATTEQVLAAGDLCAICQEKMHAPILLQCKHIFCEDCASEWLERERTCPLCRALVKPGDIRSFSDGSTTLFFQLF